MSKLDALRQLVAKRRMPAAGTVADRYSINYKKLGDFHEGKYDHDDHVVPWSKSAFNLDADIMVVGQDWSSEVFLSKPLDFDQQELGHTPSLPSNKNLFFFLKTYFQCSFRDTYSTDTFVFVKPGPLSSRIRWADLKKSASDYLIPQIEIVKPRAVLCLGSSAHNSVRVLHGLKSTRIRDLFNSDPFMIGKTQILGLPHTGGIATASLGGRAAVKRYWENAARLVKQA